MASATLSPSVPSTPAAPMGNLLTSARMRLLIADPFLGAASLYLPIEEKGEEWFRVRAPWNPPTAATDGRGIYYYRPYIEGLSQEDRLYLVAHETYHAMALDPLRRGGRNPMLWNVAVDFRLNSVLAKVQKRDGSGVWKIPSDSLHDTKWDGLSAEEIYDRLKQEIEQKGGKVPEGGGWGMVLDSQDGDGRPLDENDRVTLEKAWQVRATQIAEELKKAGQLPGEYARFVEGVLEPTIPWQEVLRRFIRDAWSRLSEDYQWSPPNRRHLWRGMVLPSQAREGMGLLDIHVDLSGSIISQRKLEEFRGEMEGIRREACPEMTRVIYFDTRVTQVDYLGPDDPLEMRDLPGGGGTDLGVAFRWARESGQRPAATVVLTDLYGPFEPDPQPGAVIWALSPGGSEERPPYGEVVKISANV